jgi:hypothetical protein
VSRIGGTGTRTGATAAQKHETDRLFCNMLALGWKELHLGDCVGADAEMWNIGTQYFRLIGHPPLNGEFRALLTYAEVRVPKRYWARNRDIVNETDFLIALPSAMVELDPMTSGTWFTIGYARTAEKDGRIIWPDGTVTSL